MKRPQQMVSGALAVKMPALTAEQLVEEAQAYSQEAWAQIFDDYYPKVFQYCYLRTGDHAGSQDLASDVFLEALRGIRGYRYRGTPLVAWLYRIAHNLTVDYLQRRTLRPTVPLAGGAQDMQLQAPDMATRSALWYDMQAAIRRLTDDQQQVIVLRFFQGLSHEETAAAMGRRSGAVRALQNRALVALRRIMAA